MENPVGKRREIQKNETYALILESARFLFNTDGFEKTTIRAVASHANIALGTIYKHFKNKTSLLAAAFYDDLLRLYAEATESISYDVPIQDQFIHMAAFNYRYYTSRPKLSREYLNHISLADEEWLGKIEAFDKSYIEKLEEIVVAAQKQGEISAEKNSRFVALSLMADYFFVLAEVFNRQKSNNPEEMLNLLRHMVEQTVI